MHSSIIPLALSISASFGASPLGSEPAPLDDEAFQRRLTPEVMVVRAAAPAVVFVETNVLVRKWDMFWGWREGLQPSSGSGVVIHGDGYIVTNYHVVRDAQEVRCRFDPKFDEAVYTAEVVEYQIEEDLALLKIAREAETPFPTVPMGTSSDLMVGERVIAIGNPYGQTFTVSSGIISGLHREVSASGLMFQNLIQSDASINPGNSGGPLLNINGELIGINTVMNSVAENIGFAIPVDRVRQVLYDQLLARHPSWLGFELAEDELIVASIADGGPAQFSDLRPGDRVLTLRGEPISLLDDWRYALMDVQPGREISLGVERDGERLELELVGWNRADGVLYERLGLRADQLVLGRVRTVRVNELRADGPAQRAQVQVGDLIEGVRTPDGQQFLLQDPEMLAAVVDALESGQRLAIDVWRDDDGDGRFFERNRDYSEMYKGSLLIE